MKPESDPVAAETVQTMSAPAVAPSTPCCASSLLEWLDENAAELVVETYAIADTGDYGHHWCVYEQLAAPKSRDTRKAMGWGTTPKAALEDAMKGPDDPTKYDYIPPEFRHNDKILPTCATGGSTEETK